MSKRWFKNLEKMLFKFYIENCVKNLVIPLKKCIFAAKTI